MTLANVQINYTHPTLLLDKFVFRFSYNFYRKFNFNLFKQWIVSKEKKKNETMCVLTSPRAKARDIQSGS